MSEKRGIGVKFLVRAGIFSALSAILYLFVKFPVPFLPTFLEFHFDEVPLFIASFAYGPISGIFVLLIKTFIKLKNCRLPHSSYLQFSTIFFQLFSKNDDSIFSYRRDII